jgi:hypothetical protein
VIPSATGFEESSQSTTTSFMPLAAWHTQRKTPALARMAEAKSALRRALDLVLRLRRYETKETPTWFAFDDSRPMRRRSEQGSSFPE